MRLPLQISFRNLAHSDALEAKIRERAEKLDHFYEYIMACRVMVEALHKHHHKGNQFHVRIDVTVPDGELVASHGADEHHAYTDAYVAARDAFDSMRRQLEDYARRRRGDVKGHETPLHGRVVEHYPHTDYGKIETSDGRLIYFHRNSIIDADFDKLTIGTKVRFVEAMGEQGPQATSVYVIGKHDIAG